MEPIDLKQLRAELNSPSQGPNVSRATMLALIDRCEKIEVQLLTTLTELSPRVRELEEAALAAPREPFDVRCADRLADEVDVLIRRKVIDARSPAADALLDYRNPPSTPRSERIAELETAHEALQTKARVIGINTGVAVAQQKAAEDGIGLPAEAESAPSSSEGKAMIDLKEMRARWAPVARHLFLDGAPRDICELIDRCEAAEAALAAANATNSRLISGLATARATAMEEAAAVARAQPYYTDTITGKRQEWVKQEIAEKILKLAPLPPGLRAVPVETLGKLRKCLDEVQ